MSLLKSNSIQIGQSVTAANNFTLSVPSSPDGTIKLARGNSGSTTQDVLTINSSGVVSFPNNSAAYSPSPFFFFKSANQTVTTNTTTKVTFDSTLFNVNSRITLSSNTFTPTLSGYYQIFSQIYCYQNGNSTRASAAIYKNGSTTNGALGTNNFSGAATNADAVASVNAIMNFNGSSDYFEIYALSGGTTFKASADSTNPITGLTYATFVQGYYLGS